MPAECQTVYIQIRPDVLSGLIWVQTDCNRYQQTTLADTVLTRIDCICFEPKLHLLSTFLQKWDQNHLMQKKQTRLFKRYHLMKTGSYPRKVILQMTHFILHTRKSILQRVPTTPAKQNETRLFFRESILQRFCSYPRKVKL